MVKLSRIGRIAVGLAVAAVAAPAALGAQQQPTPAPQPAPEVQGWIAEIQQIEQRLGPIQARAMEDAALQREQAALNEALLAALREAGPAVQADLRRVESIQPELRAAQESGDQAQLERLVREAQQLEQRLGQAQVQALQQPQIAARATAFQDRLRARMVELDPAAEELLQRFVSLQAQILAAMQEQPGR
jgi:hypothetical protein